MTASHPFFSCKCNKVKSSTVTLRFSCASLAELPPTLAIALDTSFDLEKFLPYLLNQAAELTSNTFHERYRSRYSLSRTQWRVMANIGKFGAMAASEICRISHIEKTKVSRAVAEMEKQGLVVRAPDERDRRIEKLSLTDTGKGVFESLGREAIAFDRELRAAVGARGAERLEEALQSLTTLLAGQTAGESRP